MTEPNPIDQAFLKKLTDIVLTNLQNDKFGVRELVKESGYSHYTLTRKLHSLTNKTINQFIRETRLQKALELLHNEEMTATEVAYRVGFNNVTYFNTCFHEFFGYPPGKARKGGIEITEEINTTQSTAKKEHKKPEWSAFLIPLGILLLAVLVYLVYANLVKYSTPNKGAVIVNTPKSLAVLPFRNLSADITDQYIYDGIMEEIFNNLTKIHDLRVISHTSVEQFRNTTKPVIEIGKMLNVNYIVEGSGQKFGKSFRLRVQLIEVSTDKHIWSKSFQHQMKETKKFFRIQSQIAQDIASELKATITTEEKELIDKVPTTNLAAYDLYLKANDYQKDYQKTRNLSSYQTAINLYLAALEIDPAFTKSYTGMAKAYWDRYYYETYFKENSLDSCLVLVNKALSIDDQLDEAYYLKGRYYYEKNNFEEAVNNYDKALKINHNYADAFIQKGWINIAILGDLINGLENYHKALNLTSGKERAIILRTLGQIYADRGFVEKAKSMYNEAFMLDGDSASHVSSLCYLEEALGNLEEALKLLKKFNEWDSTNTNGLDIYNMVDRKDEAYVYAERIIKIYKRRRTLPLHDSHRIGYTFWQVGKYKEAKYYLNQQIKYGEESLRLSRDFAPAVKYDLAAAYAFSGDKEKAYKLLDEAITNKGCSLWFLSLIQNDPLFKNIRNEERFQKIVQNMESNYQASHELVRKWLEEQGML
jgi:TolB-like protein/AraC-like DNA-binding protein/Tfp pilus assembly protein PilF